MKEFYFNEAKKIKNIVIGKDQARARSLNDLYLDEVNSIPGFIAVRDTKQPNEVKYISINNIIYFTVEA